MQTPFGELTDRHLARRSMTERHDRLRMSRRRFLGMAAAGSGAVALGPILWRQDAWAAAPAQAPHLQFGADPRRSMVVSWSTPAAVAEPAVDLGPTTDYGTTVGAETRSVAGTDTLYHHVRLDGLEPGTDYHYRIRHAGTTGDDATFRTAPDGAEAFTFTAYGDQGTSAEAMQVLAQTTAAAPAFQFHVGDLCYAYSAGSGEPGPVDPAVWDQWLGLISTARASAAPWMPTVGNHEMESGYGPQGYDGVLGRFTLPGNGAAGVPVTYSFRYGNVAVVALDGNDASYEIDHNRGWTEGRQDAWLRTRLAELRADPLVDFIVVGFHNCMYCTASVHASDGGNRSRWEPIFDEFDVDVVVNGHNHVYERTHPMRGGEPASELAPGGALQPGAGGTIYYCAGGGGNAGYPFLPGTASYVTEEGGVRVPELATWSATRESIQSLLVVDVTPPDAGGITSMTLRAVRRDGSEIERVSLLRRTTAIAAAPTSGRDTAAKPARPVVASDQVTAETTSTLPATGATGLLAPAAAAAAGGLAVRALTAARHDTEV